MMSKTLLMLALAGAAFAQAPANKNTAPKGLPPAPKPTANSMAKPTMPATQPTTTAKPVAKPAVKPATTVAKPMTTAAKPAAKVKHAAKPAAPKVEAAKPAAADPEVAKDAAEKPAPELKRGRDPFVSVVMAREAGASCAGSGKKCLIIDQVMLKGIVRSQVGPIAVVTSSANKTYFLKENDPVYNGVVVKINPDSIIFRETVTDRLGKSIQREVVKKVNNSAV
jgi:hypothetical protein